MVFHSYPYDESDAIKVGGGKNHGELSYTLVQMGSKFSPSELFCNLLFSAFFIQFELVFIHIQVPVRQGRPCLKTLVTVSALNGFSFVHYIKP